MSAGAKKEAWDAKLAERWAHKAREAANDPSRYERVSVREQVKSRSFWRAVAALAVVLGGAAWLGDAELVGPVVLGFAVGLSAPRRKTRSGRSRSPDSAR